MNRPNLDKTKEQYINLYYSIGANEIISGENLYDTPEDAKKKQNCPVGFVWCNTAKIRMWK